MRTCLSREFTFLRREAAVFRGCAGRGERRGRQRRAWRGDMPPTHRRGTKTLLKKRWATKAWLVCVLNYCRGRPRAMRFTSSVLLHPTATAFWRRRHSGSSGRRSPQQQGRAWTRHDLKPGAARPRWPQLWHTRVLVHDKRQMRLRRRGTDGLLTHRWRKPDSNRRSPLKKGRALIYRAASRCRRTSSSRCSSNSFR